MRTGSNGSTPLVPTSLLLACTLTLVGFAAQGLAAAQEGSAPQGSEPAPQASPAPEASPAPQASPAPEAPPAPPSPQASPAPGTAPAPEAAPAPQAAPAPEATPEPLPRIIRVVCTDHICGNCDGKCHKNSGHVAVDKKGHCACTPTTGSALDRATRESYQRAQPQ